MCWCIQWFMFLQMIMPQRWEYNTVLTQSILTGASLAVRLCGGVHHAGLLVVAPASGASAAVASHALTYVCVGQLSLTLQQGVWIAVWVPQHWKCKRNLVHLPNLAPVLLTNNTVRFCYSNVYFEKLSKVGGWSVDKQNVAIVCWYPEYGL